MLFKQFWYIFRVTMLVRDYVLLTLFLEVANLDQLFCQFCPVLTSPNSKFSSGTTKAKSTKSSL